MAIQLQLRRDTYTNVNAGTGADGEVFVDTTNRRLVVQNGVTAGGFPSPVILSAQNSGDTNDSATGSGIDFDHNLTFSIPANFMIAKRVFRVTAHFRLTSGSAPPNLTNKLKLGSVVIGASASLVTAASLTNVQFGIQWVFQSTQAPGAAANVECMVTSALNAGGAGDQQSKTAMPVAIATNAAQVLKVATQWASAGTGTTTIALSQFILEALN